MPGNTTDVLGFLKQEADKFKQSILNKPKFPLELSVADINGPDYVTLYPQKGHSPNQDDPRWKDLGLGSIQQDDVNKFMGTNKTRTVKHPGCPSAGTTATDREFYFKEDPQNKKNSILVITSEAGYKNAFEVYRRKVLAAGWFNEEDLTPRFLGDVGLSAATDPILIIEDRDDKGNLKQLYTLAGRRPGSRQPCFLGGMDSFKKGQPNFNNVIKEVLEEACTHGLLDGNDELSQALTNAPVQPIITEGSPYSVMLSDWAKEQGILPAHKNYVTGLFKETFCSNTSVGITAQTLKQFHNELNAYAKQNGLSKNQVDQLILQIKIETYKKVYAAEYEAFTQGFKRLFGLTEPTAGGGHTKEAKVNSELTRPFMNDYDAGIVFSDDKLVVSKHYVLGDTRNRLTDPINPGKNASDCWMVTTSYAASVQLRDVLRLFKAAKLPLNGSSETEAGQTTNKDLPGCIMPVKDFLYSHPNGPFAGHGHMILNAMRHLALKNKEFQKDIAGPIQDWARNQYLKQNRALYFVCGIVFTAAMIAVDTGTTGMIGDVLDFLPESVDIPVGIESAVMTAVASCMVALLLATAYHSFTRPSVKPVTFSGSGNGDGAPSASNDSSEKGKKKAAAAAK